jgi:hypothetical protein
MNEKENIIYKKRMDEAVRDNYFGTEGKFAKIAKYLGEKIVYHSSSESDHFSELDSIIYNTYEDEEPKILEMSREDNIIDIGWNFDGLKHGKDFHITYLTESNEIKVHLNGDFVYHEMDNNLLRFRPSSYLENCVDQFYKHSLAKESIFIDNFNKAKQEKQLKKAKGFLEKLKDIWNIE